MNTIDAAHQLAKKYPGGIEAVAGRLEKSEWTLRHELTRQGSAKLGIEDAESITQFAIEAKTPNALRILNSFARNCGAAVIKLPDALPEGDDTFKGLADAAKAFSDFVASVATAVADGKVTANEMTQVDRGLSELIGRAQSIQARLAAMHDAAKPSIGD